MIRIRLLTGSHERQPHSCRPQRIGLKRSGTKTTFVNGLVLGGGGAQATGCTGYRVHRLPGARCQM